MKKGKIVDNPYIPVRVDEFFSLYSKSSIR